MRLIAMGNKEDGSQPSNDEAPTVGPEEADGLNGRSWGLGL